MKRIVLALVGIGALADTIATTAPVSGQSDDEAAPIYGVKLPQGYRDWNLISVKQLTGAGGLKQLRAQLGNDIAITAIREGKLPFPDGSIIAALHWREVSAASDNEVLASAFPGADLESSFAGSAVNVQFMVKDSNSTLLPAAGDTPILRTANRAMRRCTRSASPATSQQKIATTFSPGMHQHPEQRYRPLPHHGRRNAKTALSGRSGRF